MTRYCSDCENLNLKKEGPPGCYECKKRKKEKLFGHAKKLVISMNMIGLGEKRKDKKYLKKP